MLAAACGDNLKGAPPAALVVSPTSGLVTTEAGGTASFTVALSSRPFEDVTITLVSSQIAEGTVSPATITLTPDNFDVPVTVTLTGVDDDVADNDQPYTVRVDGGDVGMADVMATNQDDDDPGSTVTPTSGLMTTESGGTATFTVKLDTQPTSNVTIPISSMDTTEGTISPAQLVFTPANYNAPQTVTVTGVNDDIADGPQVYTINVGVATSSDATYDGFDSDNVTVTNIDNDTPGIIVTPTTIPLITSESGASSTFTVVLTTEPTANVTIALTSSDAGEGTASPGTLTFTPVNWDAPQVVTVTGVDDDLADGPQSYTIVTAPAASTDAGYFGRDAADVAVTNTDNDTAGFTVTPATVPLQTTEAGGTATFTLRLNAQPTANVTIAVASDAADEGTASPASLVFTAVNWDAPQTVTVTGVDDAIADGNQQYTVVLSPAVSTDTNYSGLDPADVALTNLDNDSAGIVVTAAANLQTTEGGGTVQFTIVLQSQPTANVTIPLTSSDTTEGTVSPAQLVFTPANFNAPQTVSVTGVDDALADGNQAYTILTGAAVSTDTTYAGMDAANVNVTNLDNDTAGFAVTPLVAQTDEGGGTAQFTVRLLSEPTGIVTISISSSDTTEGTVSPSQLVFTSTNFAAPQTVTITGVDDAIVDGNQVYTIQTGVAVSSDVGYVGQDPADVTVTNLDNDTAGILVVAAANLQTTEAGGTATFTIALQSQPAANVTIPLSSSDLTEGTVSPVSVTFTPANFAAPQTVTITGVNDAVVDGDQVYAIITGAAVSADSNYSGLDAPNVTVTNIDDDTAGYEVTPLTLTTSESGGTATFTVRLRSEPTANVTIGITSTDTTEGTVSPAQLVFTPANFNAPQTVTVTAVNDAIADGNQVYTIVTAPAVSTDTTYSGLDPANVTVTNLDDDTPGFVVSETSITTTEANNGSAIFTIRLLSEPTADVTITLTSSDLTEGTVSPAQLVFTPANFNAPRTVTVTGVDDAIIDGNQVYTIITGAAASADLTYNGRDPANVSVTNIDDDTAAILVSPTSGLITRETVTGSSGTDTFNVVLTSQPSSDVAISVASNDPTEGTTSIATLVFTPTNFNAPQTVIVTGVDDAIADGNQVYSIVLGAAVSSDPDYANIDPPDVGVTNLDNDSAGIVVSPTSGLLTNEAGASDVFTVRLLSEPTADVTIAVSSSDTTEGTVVPSTLTFTAANFATPQTVTVTGVNDAIADGNQTYLVVIAPATSADPGYNGLDPNDVTATNVDDDTPGFIIDPLDLLLSEFAGDFDTFEVRLTSQPTANVTITLTSSDTTEGTVSPSSLTFTPANFATPQLVTVTSVDDLVVDGDQVFSIVTGIASSTDPGYAGINPPDVTVTTVDNESPGVFVQARKKQFTTENGGTTRIRMRLNTQPTANVTCTVSSSDTTEGQVNPQTLIFTPQNFSTLQQITVTGLDDAILDGDQVYTIVTAPCTSADPVYNGINPRDPTVINRDNE